MEGWDSLPCGGNRLLGTRQQFPWVSLSHAIPALPGTCLLNSREIFKGFPGQLERGRGV